MKFPCTLKKPLLITQDRFGLSFSSKRLGYLAATIVTCSLQIILLSNYSATYNFSTCRHYLTENYLSFPSAPRWVRHSYLSKGLRFDPYTCGPSRLFSGTIAREWSAFGKEKLILHTEIYCHLLLWKTILWGVCLGYLHLDQNHKELLLNLLLLLKIFMKFLRVW